MQLIRLAVLSGLILFSSLASVAAQEEGPNSTDSSGEAATVELPLVGKVTVPEFIAGLLGMDGGPEGQQQGGQGQPGPTAVVFQKAEPQTVGETFRFIGRIAPIERVEIRARVSGFIEEVAFEGGEAVREGDVLFRIQSAQYDATLASARAQLASAEAMEAEKARELVRKQELRESGTVSQASLDEAISAAETARAQVDQAKAAVQQAELNVSYTTIEAPIDGQISAPLITRGNFVSPSSNALAELVQLDPIWGVFSLGETRLLEWRRLGIGGAQAAPIEGEEDAAGGNSQAGSDYRLSLLLPDGTTYEPAGEFSFVGNEVDAQTGTVELRVRFSNADRLLLPNQNVSLQVSEIDPPVLPVIPQAAVQLGRDGRAVWIVRDDDTVARLPIEITRAPDPGQIAVTSGLDGGERVIVRGALQLEDGQKVDPRLAGDRGGAPQSGGASNGSVGNSGAQGGDGSGGNGSGSGGSGEGEDQ